MICMNARRLPVLTQRSLVRLQLPQHSPKKLLQQQSVRPLSFSRKRIDEARMRLGLPPSPSKNVSESAETDKLSMTELRQAYFAAAKQCHPDLHHHHQQPRNGDNSKRDGSDFLLLTQAYELLQREIIGVESKTDDFFDSIITVSEEEAFRRMCQAQLGIPADIVEECKSNPMFRQWLQGKTDAAMHWRSFLMQNGGLAPKLRSRAGWLPAGDKDTIAQNKRRLLRRRKR